MPPISDNRHPDQRISPSFEKFGAATPESSRIKQRNRKKDTKAEVALRRALWKRGLRYRLHAKDLPGTPDIVFRTLRLVVFVDGDFWHGRDWDVRKEKLSRGANSIYWISKIAYNRERDRKNNAKLTRMDWLVVRFWETDLKRNLVACVDQIERLVAERRACI
jgi:DNA mismatch endonuclease (patch repair protein)